MLSGVYILNLLENTDIPIVNSYVAFAYREPENITGFNVKDIEIGWHEGIQVTSGFMPNSSQHTQIFDSDQIINQVFIAAIDFGSNFAYKGSPKAIQIAQAIQDAAYEGTIRAAAAYAKKKVILTLIGGGVFHNKIAWIANALERMKDFIIKSGLEVTLIIFNGNNYPPTQIKSFRERMQQLARKTGGQYIQYSSANLKGKLLEKKEPIHKKAKNITDSLQALSRTLHNLQKKLLQ